MDIIKRVVESSTIFEKNNTKIKKEYLLKNINIFNDIARKVSGYKGFFGVGYPFYAFIKNSDRLPIIEEQIRYNNELLDKYNKLNDSWYCQTCLRNNNKVMPDLKLICKRCQNMHPDLKPRKIVTMIPDMDLWIVIEDKDISIAKKELIELFKANNIFTSDVNPIKTINDFYEIVMDIQNDKMPQKYLPIDVHIIGYNKLYNCITNVTSTVADFLDKNRIPYMPVSTEALRKKWQYDEEAIDFIHDFIYSLTEYDFDDKFMDALTKSRKELIKLYNKDVLYDIVLKSGKPLVARRQENIDLQKNFKERMDLWEQL